MSGSGYYPNFRYQKNWSLERLTSWFKIAMRRRLNEWGGILSWEIYTLFLLFHGWLIPCLYYCSKFSPFLQYYFHTADIGGFVKVNLTMPHPCFKSFWWLVILQDLLPFPFKLSSFAFLTCTLPTVMSNYSQFLESVKLFHTLCSKHRIPSAWNTLKTPLPFPISHYELFLMA